MYSGVPLIDVSTTVFIDMARAKPKSHSLTRPCAPIRMFCGLMSLAQRNHSTHVSRERGWGGPRTSRTGG
jgi:hypothetical protein